MPKPKKRKIYAANVDGVNLGAVKTTSQKRAAEVSGFGISAFQMGYTWDLDDCDSSLSYPDVEDKVFYMPISNSHGAAWREHKYHLRHDMHGYPYYE